MKRVRNIGCIASLILCLAMLFAWGRSTGTNDMLSYSTFHIDGNFVDMAMYSCLSRRGSVGPYIIRQRREAEHPYPPSEWSWQESGLARSDDHRFPELGRFGLNWGRTQYGSPFFMVPYWLLVLLLSIAPLRTALRQRRRYRRALEGTCLECGYDLRATPGRCPECGTAAQ